MKTKLIILQVFFIVLAAPLALFAQELQTIISADQITVQPDNIVEAKGNVIVKRGDVSIRAEAMIVNEEINQINFQDIIKFSDGKSLKLTGKDAILSDDLSAGIINAAQVLIDDTIRIRAEEIRLKNGSVESAKTIDRITSCEECEGRAPLWYFTASSATNASAPPALLATPPPKKATAQPAVSGSASSGGKKGKKKKAEQETAFGAIDDDDLEDEEDGYDDDGDGGDRSKNAAGLDEFLGALEEAEGDEGE